MLDFTGTEECTIIAASALELGVLLSVADEDLDAAQVCVPGERPPGDRGERAAERRVRAQHY